MHSQRIKILGLIVLLLVPYAALGSFIIDPPEQVNVFTPSQGEGWLTGWQYRKSHTITGSAGAGTDYQVRIIVHRTTGTDSGENVYLDSHCLTNFADVRFADDDGNTELDYWMEEKTDYDDATFWVEIADSLESANVNIYVYYGNIDVSTTSSGANTFLFYEDWATQSVRPAVWDVFYDTGGSMSYSSTDAQQGGYVAKIEGSAGMGAIGYESDYLLAAPHALMFRAKVEATVGANQELRIGSGTPTLWPLAVIETGAGTHVFRSYDEDGNIDDQTMDSSLFDGYHAFEITRSGTHARLYADGVLEETGSCDPDTVSTSIASFSAHDSGYYLWSDWFAGRKYIASEPAHDSWGRETAVGGESWLSGWNYRQRYTISGAAGAGVNYQIKILVEYGFGSSSSGSVYCELHCQTDFGDIRFTDNDGDTQLDYWMEEKTDSDDATFWVEVADDLGSNQSI